MTLGLADRYLTAELLLRSAIWILESDLPEPTSFAYVANKADAALQAIGYRVVKDDPGEPRPLRP